MGLEDNQREEMLNSIRALTGIDVEIIDSVFKGLYLANMQRVKQGRSTLIIPDVGVIKVRDNPADEEIRYDTYPEESLYYAINQAKKGNIIGLKDILESIIDAKPTKLNDEIIHMLLTEDELIDLGVMD